jgi:hypothetical protein
MTVAMGIRHRESGEYQVIPVATSAAFRDVWLPACDRLGLEWVARFHDGSLTTVAPHVIPEIVAELERMRVWATIQQEMSFVVEKIDVILQAIRDNDVINYEFDVG